MDSPSPASSNYYSSMEIPSPRGSSESREVTPDEPSPSNRTREQDEAFDLVDQLELLGLREGSTSPLPQQLIPGAFPISSTIIPSSVPSSAATASASSHAATAMTKMASSKPVAAPSPPVPLPPASSSKTSTPITAIERSNDTPFARTITPSPASNKNSVLNDPRSPLSDLSSSSPFPKTPTDPHLTKPIVSPAPPSRRTAVIFQAACEGHRYIRTPDVSGIVERPERIRAVKTGVAAAWARLESRNVAHGGVRWIANPPSTPTNEIDTKELDDMFSNMGLKDSKSKGKGKEILGGPFDLLHSTSRAAVDDQAILYVHPLPNLAPDTPDVEKAPATTPEKAPATTPTTSNTSSTPTRSTRTATSTPQRSTAVSEVPSSAPSKMNFDHDSQPNSRPETTPSSPLPWPQQLANLCRNSTKAISTAPTYSEIPAHLPQGDLYLSEQSEEAIFGAIGAICEGVDRIVQGARTRGNGYDRAFVAIRPPGHHCCESAPMGFCFLNNVAVAAAHAHIKHGIERVVILDIDLHHGNGTQEIAWRINAEANRAAQEMQSRVSPRKGSPKKGTTPSDRSKDLQIMYASLHDIFSYPCEDGDPAMIQAASLNLAGGHSQWISNVHLESFEGEAEFHEKLYPKYRDGLLGAAGRFLAQTALGNDEDDHRTLIIISAGMDASQHESAGMSRHRRNVPTSFYHRFARETVRLATSHAGGKVLAVLEGGYSDRALCSATMALMVGLTESPRLLEKTFLVEDGNEMLWWDEKNLIKIEKACKPKRGKLHIPASASPSIAAPSVGMIPFASITPTALPPSIASAASGSDTWLARTVEIFAAIEGSDLVGGIDPVSPKDKPIAGSRTMQLRERRPRGAGSNSISSGVDDGSLRNSAQSSPAKIGGPADLRTKVTEEGTIRSNSDSFAEDLGGMSTASTSSAQEETVEVKSAFARFSDTRADKAEVTSMDNEHTLETSQGTSKALSHGPKVKFTWRQGGI